MKAFIRWAFFPISFVINQLSILAQAAFGWYFHYKIKGTIGEKLDLHPTIDPESIKGLALLTNPDEYGIVRNESHCLLQQGGNILLRPELAEVLLERMMKPDGSLYRRFPNDEHHLGVSQDCLASWLYTYTLFNVKRPDLVRRLASHYLKNCFGLNWEAKNGVSVRSSAGGFAPTVDGWPSDKLGFGFSQPISGPTYLSAAALFALAAREVSFLWNIAYYLYYVLFGGYLFTRYPAFHTKKDLIYYTWHISLLCLASLKKCGKNTDAGMRYLVCDIAPGGNMQPHMAAIANEAGVLSEEERKLAVDTLLSMKYPQYWPQSSATGADFWEHEKHDTPNWTNMHLAYELLKEKKNGQ
jgi:hypothetical protein